MTKHILTVAAAALLAIPTFIIAQDAPPAGDKPAPDGGRGGRGGRGGFGGTPEERVKRMTEQLGLTTEQQTKIKDLLTKHAEANKALREKGFQNLSEEERTKFRETMKTQQDEVTAVLTPEQKEKAEKARAARGGRGGRGGGAPDGDKKPDEKKPDDKK
jgi:Spy/CpxP family protein refolding chaperone